MKKRGKTRLLALSLLIACCSLLIACDDWMRPMSDFIRDATGTAKCIGLRFSTDHCIYNNELKTKRGAEIAIPESKDTIIHIDIRNPQGYDLELTLVGAGSEKASVVPDAGNLSCTVTITNPDWLEKFKLTMTVFGNGRFMDEYNLPVMEGRYFTNNNNLASLSAMIFTDSEDSGSSAGLEPSFLKTITDYIVIAPETTVAIEIKAAVENEYSTLSIEDSSFGKSGSHKINLSDTSTKIPIVVTDDSGYSKTYTLTVNLIITYYAEDDIELKSAIDNINSGSADKYEIIITGNIDTDPLNLTGNKTVTIKNDSTARKIKLASRGSLFTVNSGAKLIFKGTDASNPLTLAGQGLDVDNTAALVTVNSSGTLELNDNAIITGNKHYGDNEHGGGVYVYAGNFVMSGGTIKGNNAYNGAGVNIRGTMTMSGGTIENNTATFGGGVYMQGGGKLYITGGIIYGKDGESVTPPGEPNVATGGDHAALYLGGGIATLNGSSISSNTDNTIQ